MTVVIDGTRTQQLCAFGQEWQAGRREITYMIEPASPEQAAAHVALDPERACVVRCRRGSKGGWNDLSYIDHSYNYGPGKFAVFRSRGWELHLGWMRSRTAQAASDAFRQQLDAARYAALASAGAQAFKGCYDAYKGIVNESGAIELESMRFTSRTPRGARKNQAFGSPYGPQRKG